MPLIVPPPATYHYTSCWRKVGADHFRLTGTLAARLGERGVYFPHDSRLQQEWEREAALWQGGRNTGSDLEWLTAVATSGNGVAEEFDEVRTIESGSLRMALETAYAISVEQHGEIVEMYDALPADQFQAKGDPFSGLFPPLTSREPVVGRAASRRRNPADVLIDTIYSRRAPAATNDEDEDALDVEVTQEHVAFA